jgi:hemolysin-activating ACP:hemolysin acyltransferase
VKKLNESYTRYPWRDEEVEWVTVGHGEHQVPETDMLGLISWLWQQCPMRRTWTVGLMCKLIWPALEHRQFALVRHQNGTPLLYVSWALLDDERERKIIKDFYSLDRADWKSGENIWLVDWVDPFGGTKWFYSKLAKTIFQGWLQHYRGTNVTHDHLKRQKLRLYQNLAGMAPAVERAI